MPPWRWMAKFISGVIFYRFDCVEQKYCGQKGERESRKSKKERERQTQPSSLYCPIWEEEIIVGNIRNNSRWVSLKCEIKKTLLSWMKQKRIKTTNCSIVLIAFADATRLFTKCSIYFHFFLFTFSIHFLPKRRKILSQNNWAVICHRCSSPPIHRKVQWPGKLRRVSGVCAMLYC